MIDKNLTKFILFTFVIFSILLINIKVSLAQSSPWSQFTEITGSRRTTSSIGDSVITYTNTRIQGISDCGPLSDYTLVLNENNNNSDRIDDDIIRAFNFDDEVSFRFGGCIQLQRDIGGSGPQPFYPLIVDVRTR